MVTDAKKGGKSHTPVKRKQHDDSLMKVSPGDSGVGLPYAPVDWPNPGDVWGWRVGRRINTSGFFQDRFLSGPERLQEKPNKKLTFASKQSLDRYLQSTFSETDINQFYSLFSWEIPAQNEPDSKEKSIPSPQVLPTAPEDVMSNGGSTAKRSRKAAPKKKGKTSTTKNNNVDRAIDVFSDEIATPTGDAAPYSTEDTNCERGLTAIGYNLETNDTLENSQPSLTTEEFDSYINCLDEILYLPPPSIDEPSDNTSAIEIRKKLSSLLAMGFTSLVSSDKCNELTSLTIKLQNDPSLSSKELVMLKLIQEIPFTSKSFVEAKEVSLRADKFSDELEAKIANVASLKKEYSTSKERIEAAQSDEASTLVKILETDQQLAKLQSHKQALNEAAKAINKKINELSSTQKRVMDRLPKIVQEVQLANSEKSQWEVKREKAGEQEAEILAKFAPLEGFSFCS